jgi:hypothetical protein
MRPKQRVVTTVQRYLANPVARRLAGYVPGTAVLETTGRRTGKRRRTPVGGRMRDGSFWLVAEFGRRADYVRNLEADPRRFNWLGATSLPSRVCA